MINIRHLRANGYEGVYFEDENGNTLGIERIDEFDEHHAERGRLDTSLDLPSQT